MSSQNTMSIVHTCDQIVFFAYEKPWMVYDCTIYRWISILVNPTLITMHGQYRCKDTSSHWHLTVSDHLVELVIEFLWKAIVGAVGPPSGIEKNMYMKMATDRITTRLIWRKTLAMGCCFSDVISRRCSACSSAVFFSDSTSSDMPHRNWRARFQIGGLSDISTEKWKLHLKDESILNESDLKLQHFVPPLSQGRIVGSFDQEVSQVEKIVIIS